MQSDAWRTAMARPPRLYGLYDFVHAEVFGVAPNNLKRQFHLFLNPSPCHVLYWLRVLVALVLGVCAPVQTEARLGKDAKGIEHDRVSLHLQMTETKSGQGYRYQILSSPDLVVKQYVNPKTGIVFAVTWRGRRMPDLIALLGFDPGTLQGTWIFRSLHHSRFETRTLSYEDGGHVGFYVGRAIRTDLLPAGVSRSEVVP